MTNKGITLIALVITIIILLILAGITMNALTGENGLFKRAKEADNLTRLGKAKETLETLSGEYQIGKYVEDWNDLEAFLKGKLGNENVWQNSDGKTLTVVIDGFRFIVDKDTFNIAEDGKEKISDIKNLTSLELTHRMGARLELR